MTDALGRTVDFTNTILIMTSNLGVKEAGNVPGFWRSEENEGAVYVQAAEKFFRPEFFNRLDRVVPFERLGRDDVRRIARQLIRGVFAREGLIRRKCILQVDDQALEQIVDQGYHPLLGARALKRAIERQLTQPVAARLSLLRPDTPTVVSLYPSGNDIAVHVQDLTQTEPQEVSKLAQAARDPKAVLERVEAAILRIESEVSHLQPDGAIALEAIRPEHVHYFIIKEQVHRLRVMYRRIADWLGRPKGFSIAQTRGSSRAKRFLAYLRDTRAGRARRIWNDVANAQDTHSYLQELASGAALYGQKIEDHVADMLREAALLQAMARGAAFSGARVLVYLRSLDGFGQVQRAILSDLYAKLFGSELGLEATIIKDGDVALRKNADALFVQGPYASALAKGEEGTHLFCTAEDQFVPIQVTVLSIGHDEDARSELAAHAARQQQWLALLSQGKASVDDDPFRLRPVIRLYDERGVTLDLRSELIALRMPSVSELRAFILAALPLPQELTR